MIDLKLDPDTREMLLTRKEGDPKHIVLSGWNEGRYKEKNIPCPKCESLDLVYEDKWAPYYLLYDSCVCMNCFIEFHFAKATSDKPVIYDSIKQLTIRNYLYMTEYDIWQEDYYDKNGQYYLQLSG